MKLLEINKDTCTMCGMCAEACPAGIIEFIKQNFPEMAPGTDKMCIRCGHCVAICPTKSVLHKEIPVEQCISIDDSSQVTAGQCEKLIMNRRSIREFRDIPVPGDIIEHIIDISRYSPTARNMQNVRWMVVNDSKMMDRLKKLGADWLRWTVKNIPRAAEMFERPLKMMEEGKDFFLREASALVIAYAEKSNPSAVTDCTIALSYFDLIAYCNGLGCCWAGYFQYAATSFAPMIEALALPQGFVAYGCLMIGYPKYKYRLIPPRKQAMILYRN